MGTSQAGADSLDHLFHPPLPPLSSTAPARLFGVTGQSTDTLLKSLKDNHTKYHVFFNDRGFHNHSSHHLLAIYALGASGGLIEAAYTTHTVYQRPAYASPVTITESNFTDHLGKEDNYNAYLRFFSQALSEEGADIGSVLEKFIFSEKYNFDKNRNSADKTQPEMLDRLLAGLVHPMIHSGYGVEFGLRGMLAEGLAQTAVHKAETASVLLSQSFYDFAATSPSTVSRITNLLPNLSLQQSPSSTAAGSHLFVILAQMLNDTRLDPGTLKLGNEDIMAFAHTLKTSGEVIRGYAEQWDFHLVGDASDEATLNAKVEELYWAHVLMYGVGGWSKTKGFRADFFTMHLVTSAIFLPGYVSALKKPSSKRSLLRSYLCICLAWWVSRGRPGFDIGKFYEATGGDNADNAGQAAVPGPQPTPVEKALGLGGKPLLTPNPWLPILQTTLTHPNEHLCKLQRSLAHAAVQYGDRKAGHFARLTGLSEVGVSTGIAERPGFEGIEKLDGSLFVRVARLTADRLAWMREGEEERDWDRDGFY